MNVTNCYGNCFNEIYLNNTFSIANKIILNMKNKENKRNKIKECINWMQLS